VLFCKLGQCTLANESHLTKYAVKLFCCVAFFLTIILQSAFINSKFDDEDFV